MIAARRSLLVLALVGMALHPGCARAAQAPARTAVLENDRIKLTFSAGDGLRLASLHSKAQGRELLDPAAKIPLYQLEFERGGKLFAIQPGSKDRIAFERPEPGVLRIVVHNIQYDFATTVTVALPREAATASFRLGVKGHRGKARLAIARFPGYGVRLEPGKPGRVLLPVADGTLIEDPLRAMKDGEGRLYQYPGIASAQLMAAYDDRGGVATWSADGAGHLKLLSVRRFGAGLALPFEAIAIHDERASVEIPYAVEVGTFEGSWEAAADLYKGWALRQAWCRTRLEQRAIPASLRNPSFFLGTNLREGAPGGKAVDRTSAIAAHVEDWTKGLGMPVASILLSWEKHGPWIAPDYFPPYGGDAAFKALTGRLRAQGSPSMLYLSGLNVTLEKTARHGAGSYRANKAEADALLPAAIVGRNGKIQREGRPEEGTGERVVLCPATAQARSTLGRSWRSARALGVDIVQIDQIVGGGTPICFSTGHGHPFAGGDWMYRSVAALLDSVRGADPGAAIALEEPGELFIDRVDVFHTREYMQGLWPRDGAGVVGVPLFAYLYHEYALGYGGDSAPIRQESEDPEAGIYAQAMNLAAGRFPGAAAWMRLVPYAKVHASQRRFMQDAAELWKGEAGRLLQGGRILNLPRQASRSRTFRARIEGADMTFRGQDILARGFEGADGRIGILYINPTPSPVEVKLDFEGGRIPPAARQVWPADGGAVRSGDARRLPAFGILFLIAG